MPRKAITEQEPSGQTQTPGSPLDGQRALVANSKPVAERSLIAHTNPVAGKTFFLEGSGTFEAFLEEIRSLSEETMNESIRKLENFAVSNYDSDEKEPETLVNGDQEILSYQLLKRESEKRTLLLTLKSLSMAELTEVFREAQSLLRERDTTESSTQAESDLVAEEIRQEVTVKWADRKKPENKGAPWTKGPVAFICHWYGKWLEDSTLTRAHLRYDIPLYDAYVAYLRRVGGKGGAPELDLPVEPRSKLQGPTEAVAFKRALGRQATAKHRASKKVM